MKQTTIAKVLLSVAALTLGAQAFLSSTAYGQIELIDVDPPDGAELEAPPENVHFCFSEPVLVTDDGVFAFKFVTPEELGLGFRAAFQPDGECVTIYPGLPDEPPAGEYRLEWQVTAAASGEESSGVLRYNVTEGAAVERSPTPETTVIVTAGATPAGTPGSPDNNGESGDDQPDILLVALITVGGLAGAAVLFSLGFLIRRRIGFEPHRPPEDGGEGGGEH